MNNEQKGCGGWGEEERDGARVQYLETQIHWFYSDYYTPRFPVERYFLKAAGPVGALLGKCPALEEADFEYNYQLFSTKDAVVAFAAGLGEAGLPGVRKIGLRRCDIPAEAVLEDWKSRSTVSVLSKTKISDFEIMAPPGLQILR